MFEDERECEFDQAQLRVISDLRQSPLAGGWLSGKFGEGKENKSRRAERISNARYDLAEPGNQKKLEVVTQLNLREA
jgi:aryl-alcohol dehydrogenase-like predicted oxidoreductase